MQFFSFRKKNQIEHDFRWWSSELDSLQASSLVGYVTNKVSLLKYSCVSVHAKRFMLLEMLA